MDAMQAICERFSFRGEYERTPVPRNDLMRIMEAGLAAPSGCNKQTTSLIGIDDEMVGMISSFLGRTPDKTAPAAICVFTQRIPGYDDVYFNIQDYSAAIENMLLAITALGYASCWIEGEVTGNKEVREKISAELRVPGDFELVAFLPVGKAKQDKTRPSKKAFEQRAWFNRYK